MFKLRTKVQFFIYCSCHAKFVWQVIAKSVKPSEKPLKNRRALTAQISFFAETYFLKISCKRASSRLVLFHAQVQ